MAPADPLARGRQSPARALRETLLNAAGYGQAWRVLPMILAKRTDMDNAHAAAYDGQEINLVVGQQFTKALSVAAKLAYAWFDGKNDAGNSYGNDARLFVTYEF